MAGEIDRFLEGYAPEVHDVAQQVRVLIASITPDADETLKPGWKVIWYGFGTKMAAQFVVLMPSRAHVGLGFAQGSELSDPKRRLEGTGKKIRHVKLRTRADVFDPALAALVRAQVALTRAQAKKPSAPAKSAKTAKTKKAATAAKARGPASRAASPRRKRASSR
jgi:hypothetical protein